MKVSFGRFEKVDSHTAELDVILGGEAVGMILKSHGDLPGSLSMVDTPGPVEFYEVTLEMDDGDLSKVFETSSYPSAAKALNAAKAWARKTLKKESA